jgi:hypothetical protein
MLIAGLVGLSALAGCSSQSTTTDAAGPPAPAKPQSSVAQGYSAASNSLSAVVTQLRTALNSVTSVSQIVGPIASYATALNAFDTTVLNLGASGRAATDIRTLVGYDGAIIGELDVIGTQTPATLPAWESAISVDQGKAAQASNAVRADLGLPPPAS